VAALFRLSVLTPAMALAQALTRPLVHPANTSPQRIISA